MEIVIESDPYRPSSTSPAPTYLRSPVTSQQPVISSSSAFYYATLPRGGAAARLQNPSAADTLDGASTTTSVRRVDKSGLLEIADLEPAGRANSSRLLTGAESHVGTLSRRIERSGLLEAVPEVPDQCHRGGGLASDELLAAAATTRSMVERQQHLLVGAETDIVESVLLRRRASYATDSQDSSSSTMTTANPSENETTVSGGCNNNNNNNNNSSSSSNNSTTRSSQRVKFATDESSTVVAPATSNVEEIKEPRKTSVVDCLGRLSPRQRDRHVPMSLSNIPDVIEAHGTVATGPTTGVASTMTARANGDAPEGERAEAEGCEHTAIESVEEARVTYKGTTTGTATGTGGPANNKIGHNDNIQAVHVIILSEQL